MTEAWHDFPSPGLITQADGSAFQWENCAPATWAGLIVAQRQGHRPEKGTPWYPTGESLRNASGDRSGGITPGLLDSTTNRVYGEDLIPTIATESRVVDLLGQGYAIGLLHQYGPISDAGYSCSPGFRGAHSSGMYGLRAVATGAGAEVLWADPLADGRRSGIYKGMRWIPWSTALKAAGALVLDNSGETVRERYGAGHLYIVQTTVPYRPSAPLPPPLAVLTEGYPATSAERRNRMIAPAYGAGSNGPLVKHLVRRQPLYDYPGGHVVTRMSAARAVTFLGKAGPGWDLVVVGTGVPYSDKQTRPTGLYVPRAAGTVVDR